MRIKVLLTTFLLLGVTCRDTHADVSIERVDYHGWKGCYRLANGSVELIFVPQIGRIMRFGFLGGTNALWENLALSGKIADPASKDWTNFGGDKLWPAPQERWGWPPDPALDAQGYEAHPLPNGHLLVTSKESAKHGVRFIREIALEPAGAGATIINTMENVSGKPVEWSVWEIAQVNDPLWAEIPVDDKSILPKRIHTFDDPSVLERGFSKKGSIPRGGASYQLTRDAKKSGKIGTDAQSQWARAQIADVQFTILGAGEKNSTYPDKGCLQEIYSNPDDLKYMELELLSPLRTLSPKSKTSFTTRWKLEKAKGN
jgi:hypothetical protein